VNLVSLGKKKLRQIGAVLAGDAGDQCALQFSLDELQFLTKENRTVWHDFSHRHTQTHADKEKKF
jgi:hypothetical protein